MKIKIESLLIDKDNSIAERIGSDNAFWVRDLKFNVDPKSLEVTNEDPEILKCLKYYINENKNLIDYLEVRELIDTSNIICTNFWNEEEFNRTCKFEFRDYFNLEECKYVYIN
ncbi:MULTISPECIES: hypothetical protein [Clostridium]|uniref:Uncharacterized protein n=1 Tax=Clostridium disporicum TaxID=84024 RepID=A0A174K2L3_9CLOT|nr:MULTISPECIES: hypothetical protein [Clostridium]MCD2502248.1 hypothetical protein [Clostridium sp. NSJ-145]CUP06262.1 Uncharacterised protein [Clostridium disporicum]